MDIVRSFNWGFPYYCDLLNKLFKIVDHFTKRFVQQGDKLYIATP